MPKQISKRRELKPIGYELFIGALSVLSIINLVLLVVIRNDENLRTVIYIMNAIMFPSSVRTMSYG